MSDLKIQTLLTLCPPSLLKAMTGRKNGVQRYRLIKAGDKEQLFSAIQKKKPEVLVLGPGVPGLHSKKNIRRCRELLPEAVIIAVSDKIKTSQVADLIHAGLDECLPVSQASRVFKTIEKVRDRRNKRSGGVHDAQYHDVLERITDSFIALDKNFCYTYVNARTGELVGRDPRSLVGRNVWEEFPDAVNSSTYRAFLKAMKEQRFVSNVDYYAPLDLWQENLIYPSPEGLSVFIKDISERKRLEQKLLDQQRDHDRNLTSAVLKAQEKERSFIGQELHDNVNQIILGSKMILEHLKKSPGRADTLIPYCIENLSKAIEENRKLAHELVAPDVEKHSLKYQLRHLIQPMLRPGGVHAVLQTAGLDEKRLDRDKKLNVFRIAQEQCSNIAKYSKASQALFSLKTYGNMFNMVIEDNGQGSDNTARRGLGLKNIEGRVSIFNGTMKIQTARGEGFKLEIELPLEK